ncbi:MAG: M56 family metallopeptidase [bacterium]|nr:M56 family metallopeptidase [bacterium]
MSFAEIPWFEALRLMIDINLKGALICLFALLIIGALRRSSASLRNQIWVGTLIALLALPLLSLIVPEYGLSLFPDPRFWSYEEPVPISDAELQALLAEDGLIGPQIPGSMDLDISKPFWLSMSLPHFIVLIWTVGLMMMAAWLIASDLQLRRIMRKAVPTDRSWQDLLTKLSRTMGLERNVYLLRSPHIRAGITLGVFRPVVIFPIDAEEWSDSRRRLVLSHELAHIKRWDSLIEILAGLVMVLYWFNPLVWYAVKHLRIERERDCDNVVLNIGAKPSDYAMQLMEIAADYSKTPVPAFQSTRISQGSNLKDRLLFILDPSVERQGKSRRSTMSVVLIVVALALPLSAFGFWDSVEPAKVPLTETKMKSEELKEKTKSKSDKQRNSAAWRVGESIYADGLDAGKRTFKALKSEPKGKIYFKESEFNQLGYEFLGKQMIDEALTVFKINVALYPEAWNVYDSMGEAYVHKGEYALASKFYQRSLTLGSQVEKQAKMILKRLQKAIESESVTWSPDDIIVRDMKWDETKSGEASSSTSPQHTKID